DRASALPGECSGGPGCVLARLHRPHQGPDHAGRWRPPPPRGSPARKDPGGQRQRIAPRRNSAFARGAKSTRRPSGKRAVRLSARALHLFSPLLGSSGKLTELPPGISLLTGSRSWVLAGNRRSQTSIKTTWWPQRDTNPFVLWNSAELYVPPN